MVDCPEVASCESRLVVLQGWPFAIVDDERRWYIDWPCPIRRSMSITMNAWSDNTGSSTRTDRTGHSNLASDDDIKSMSTVMSDWLDMLNEREMREDRVEMYGMCAVDLIQMNIDITKDDQRTRVCGSTFENVREFLKECRRHLFRTRSIDGNNQHVTLRTMALHVHCGLGQLTQLFTNFWGWWMSSS